MNTCRDSNMLVCYEYIQFKLHIEKFTNAKSVLSFSEHKNGINQESI